MKLFAHRKARLEARPDRASGAAGFARSLCASSFLHLFLIALLGFFEVRVPDPGGAGASSSTILFAAAPRARVRAFPAVRPEEVAPITDPFREPDEYETEDVPHDWSALERFDGPRIEPIFERVPRRLASLPSSMTLVVPEALEHEEFDLERAAREREPEPLAEARDEPVPQPTPEPPAASEEAEDETGDGLETSEAAIVVGLPPRYPKLARRMGWQGVVELEITVAPDGSVADLFVSSSSGYDVLDEAALEAVRRWTFEAGTRGGVAIASTLAHKVRFKLR